MGLLTIACCFRGYGQETTHEWLQLLNHTIGQSEKYYIRKLTQIDQIHQSQTSDRQGDLFSFYLRLYDEYASFNCDSAYAYAQKLQDIARQSGSTSRAPYARMKLSFILLSSGMFKEAFDSLGTVSLQYLNTPKKWSIRL
jgi:hypothetical protein